jgi:hypothetical protein
MRNALLLAICCSGLAAAADAPYAGTWKMNVARSDFGDTTITYKQMPGGEMKATADGVSYTFKTDGKDNMTPWGMTVAWKEAANGGWEVIEKTNGKVTATSIASLSGDMLTVKTKRVKADGKTSDDSTVFQRVSGGPGLVGKWKTRNLKTSSPETLTLTPKGNNGVVILLGNEGASCDARFDGKDYPATGPMWPAGWTCLVTKSGARGIDLTWKKDGKDMYKSTLTASTDGKVLTEIGSATGANEQFKVVYERHEKH